MTLEQELTDPFLSAVAEAQAEMEQASSIEPPSSQPEAGIEAEVLVDTEEEESEQAESELEPLDEQASEDSDELFADLEAPEIEEVVTDDDTPIEDQSFALPGIDEPVSLQELKDGYLRQADYTRKTQSLAAERAQAEKADQFWQALTTRGADVARQLAEAAGLIEPGATPVKVVDLPFVSDEEVQARVDREVEQAIANHPDILAAQEVVAERWIESEFARIEEAYSTKLGQKSRDLILRTAYAKQVDDLEMVFQALLAKQNEVARQRDSLKQAAPAKPTGKAMAQSAEDEINDFADAVAAAKAEIGI